MNSHVEMVIIDNNKQIVLLKEIGRRLLCLEDEFQSLLPNFPTLRGSEFIFTIGWANAGRYINKDVDFFIKGLHILEVLYRNKTQNDFGFGSPSPTHKILQKLREKNEPLAIELTNWIANSGGNYYIKKLKD
jgi:hypothetical protein